MKKTVYGREKPEFLPYLWAKEVLMQIKPRNLRQKFCEVLTCIITYKDSFPTMIPFAFYDELLSSFF